MPTENFGIEVVKEIERLARATMAAQTVPAGNIPYVIVPDGCKDLPMADLIYNEHSAKPERIKQKVTVLDATSFIEYYSLFADLNSRTFADESKLTVVSVLDYHGAKEGSPRWGQHQVTLGLRTSEEWKRWTAANNHHMGQQEFAEFLEQNSLDITDPAPASIIEIANELQATTEVEFGSGIRQADGQIRFKYTESTKATVGAGQVQVPDHFTIQIPAFVGGERVPVKALLRFRVKEGTLTFWFTLIRPEEVIRTAFIAARTAIAATLGIIIINGTL